MYNLIWKNKTFLNGKFAFKIYTEGWKTNLKKKNDVFQTISQAAVNIST